MNFDRNTIIGFIVLAVLFLGYFFYTSKEQQAYQQATQLAKQREDSIARANRPVIDSAAVLRDSAAADSANRVAAAGGFQAAAGGTEGATAEPAAMSRASSARYSTCRSAAMVV